MISIGQLILIAVSNFCGGIAAGMLAIMVFQRIPHWLHHRALRQAIKHIGGSVQCTMCARWFSRHE